SPHICDANSAAAFSGLMPQSSACSRMLSSALDTAAYSRFDTLNPPLNQALSQGRTAHPSQIRLVVDDVQQQIELLCQLVTFSSLHKQNLFTLVICRCPRNQRAEFFARFPVLVSNTRVFGESLRICTCLGHG